MHKNQSSNHINSTRTQNFDNINLLSVSYDNLRQVRIVHWNCNTLSNKTHLIQQFINESKAHIICLKEIRSLTELANYNLSQFTEYSSVIKCRIAANLDARTAGDGMAIMVQLSVEFAQLTNFKSTTSELVGIKLAKINGNALLHDKSLLSRIATSCTNYVIAGDLNAKHNTNLGCKSNNQNGFLLTSFVNDHSAHVLNSHLGQSFTPAHIDYAEKLWILVSDSLVSKIKRISLIENSPLSSDHVPIQLELNQCFQPIILAQNSDRYIFSKARWSVYSQELIKAASQLDSEADLHDLSDSIEEAKRYATDKAVPKSNKETAMLTLQPYILAMIKEKRRWRHVLEKNPSSENKKSTTN